VSRSHEPPTRRSSPSPEPARGNGDTAPVTSDHGRPSPLGAACRWAVSCGSPVRRASARALPFHSVVRLNPCELQIDLLCRGVELDASCRLEQDARGFSRTRAGLGSGLEMVLAGAPPLSKEENYCDNCRLCAKSCASGLMKPEGKIEVTLGGASFSYADRWSYLRCHSCRLFLGWLDNKGGRSRDIGLGLSDTGPLGLSGDEFHRGFNLYVSLWSKKRNAVGFAAGDGCRDCGNYSLAWVTIYRVRSPSDGSIDLS